MIITFIGAVSYAPQIKIYKQQKSTNNQLLVLFLLSLLRLVGWQHY